MRINKFHSVSFEKVWMPEKTKFIFFIITVLTAAAVVLFSTGWGEEKNRSESAEKEKYKYAGAAACMMCHTKEELGKQFQAWTGSRHARSYLALGTGRPEMIEEKAKSMVEVGHGREIAQEAMRLGVDIDCLKCHATAEVDTSFFEQTFHIEDGVQCEICHGPGSGHVTWMKEMTTEKSEKLSPKVQLKMPTMEDCMACHREKPSHAVLKSNPFDFDKAWKEIAHPIPEK